MQVLVGVLNELDKFNNAVNIFSEKRKNDQGDEVAVETVYVGLGAAYFVNDADDFAGMGLPGRTDGNGRSDRSSRRPSAKSCAFIATSAARSSSRCRQRFDDETFAFSCCDAIDPYIPVCLPCSSCRGPRWRRTWKRSVRLPRSICRKRSRN